MQFKKDPKNRPIIETERLILRPFHMADAKRVQFLAGDPKVAATTLAIPHPYLDGMAEKWIALHDEWFANNTNITFAIVDKSNDVLMGCIDFMAISKRNQKAEIGYWIGVEFWNKGFVTEAMKAMVRYGFEELKLNKITCRHMSTNPASGKVMLKAGLKHEGTLREENFKNGKFVDSEVYGILASEYKK